MAGAGDWPSAAPSSPHTAAACPPPTPTAAGPCSSSTCPPRRPTPSPPPDPHPSTTRNAARKKRGVMHPRLLWDDIAAAASAVLGDHGAAAPFAVELIVQDVPG